MTFKYCRATAVIFATLSLAATAAASASATPWDPNSTDPAIPLRPAPEPAMVSPAPGGVGSAPVVVRVTTARGFDWSDAAIGAAGGIALSMVGVGGFLVASQSQPPRTAGTNALPD